ncbi:hypothetical protein C5N92_03485 [Glaesserella australis]|uniref:Uncharacterized protein n=1 Tax=Glaesserella australis TaxID=2094024 RepID=A0A328C2A6_9PAST|nr:hypothetical protein CJD39_06060 [Glaesserella sp. 15-184]RAL19190.1 hypothetical protein C5N92_03485 [Glaesserella australis]
MNYTQFIYIVTFINHKTVNECNLIDQIKIINIHIIKLFTKITFVNKINENNYCLFICNVVCSFLFYKIPYATNFL